MEIYMNNEKFFPSDYDEYYYYCRISIVEEAKEKYINCNRFLLGTNSADSPAIRLLSEETDEKKSAIYNKYKKLYQDFILYCDKLINKEDIDSEDVFKRYMENLMRISCDTIVFTYENFGMQKNILLNQKFKYNNEERKLSDIINQNANIPYILNPDEPISKFIDKHFKVIWYIIIFTLAIFGVYCFSDGLSETRFIVSILEYFLSSVLLVTALVFFIFGVKNRKKFRLIENRSNANSRNHYHVFHPYKNNFSIKSVIEILGLIIKLKE